MTRFFEILAELDEQDRKPPQSETPCASDQETGLNSLAGGANMLTMRQPTRTERIQALAYARVSSEEQEKEGFSIRKAKEFRARQNTILKSIEDHQSANQSYMEEGIRILELASRAAELFAKQPAEEKRRLLNCILKGAFWQHGSLKADFRQPFDMLAKTALSNSASDSKENPIEASTGEKEIWLPGMDSNHDSRLQRPLSYR